MKIASNKKILHEMKKYIVPKFNQSSHKGQSGKICVVGGSFEYSGAPYLSGAGALRAGADLAYIVTTPHASIPIKTYSPDLIVLPFLPEYSENIGQDDKKKKNC